MTTTTMREQHEAKRKARYLATCSHYTGALENEYCALGVPYRIVTDRSEKPWRVFCAWPEAKAYCDKKQLPTEADWETKQKRELEALQRYAEIRRAILATGETQGGIDCPCCNGRVGFSIAGNGHVAAACSTPGCAKWME